MKRGSVLIDVAIDQGGSIEAIDRITTHADPFYTKEDGIIRYSVANMPGAVPRTSTLALTNVTLPYALKIANLGAEGACKADPAIMKGLNVYKGLLTYKGVADAQNLPSIPLGDSDQLRLGEWVLAIGSPLGAQLRGTITAGIVSAKGRSMPDGSGEFKIESFIQTDAAVNPGNSGGALVNKRGELVGINTAIVSQTGSYSGYSFAVPVNIVKRVASDLIDFGSVKRAVLGITMQPIDKKIQEDLKLNSMNGVYIVEVSKGSAAEEAGLKQGDVIIAIDGQRISDGASVQEKVNNYHPGEKAVVTYIRDGKENNVEVTFHAAGTQTGETDVDGSVAFYGARLKALSADELKAMGLRSGVKIVSVGQGKMAEAGATAGSVILYVNDEPVSKPEDVIAKAKKAQRGIYIEGVDANGKSFYFGFGK